MVIKKRRIEEAIAGEKYVKWLSELSKNDIPLVGGKGANLAEMYNAKFPVPPAFCVTAQTFDNFLTKAGLKDKIAQIIHKTNVFNTTELEQNAAKIRQLVLDSEIPEDIQNEIIESYHLLSSEKTKDAVSDNNELAFVAVRSSATTEDLADASFAGQQETYTNIKGDKELIIAVKKCFASLYTARAVYYRHKKGFEKANALLSVVVQRMIGSDKSGVMFTKNPMTGKDEIIIEAVFGLGEGIVSGKILPDHYVLDNELNLIDKKIADKKIMLEKEDNGNGKEVKLKPEKSKSQVLTNSEIATLGEYGQKIENHYKKPQDIEFAIEQNKIYIVQSRPITTLDSAKNKANTKLNVKGKAILNGLAASPGIASGKVKIILDLKDLNKVGKGDILVTKMTNPDMVVSMQRAVAVLTDEGGATSHAAIVSREMGIPAVVGTEKATEILKDGQIITIDGNNGLVYDGKAESLGIEEQTKEILPIIKTRTKIKVMVDLPDFAERAAKTESDAVGLLRLEGIIAESGKHPLFYIKNKNYEEYIRTIQQGIEKISEHFKEIWIRTSDIRSDEYRNLLGANKELELNPMLGFHGIRFSLKNPELLKAEIKAIKNVAEKFKDKKFGIMFPQIISEQEMNEAYKIFKEFELKNMVIGSMIETPAAVQVIRGICKYAKFISFGTNDLTQYTLAIDRGNTECQYLYNEMHPAVLTQIKRVIDICKEYKVETSICGQAGSKKEMVEYLINCGINSISVNADVAYEISKLVANLEKQKDLNSGNNQNNMAKKTKILPIDDTTDIEQEIQEKKEEILKNKIDKENSDDSTLEITNKDLREDKEKDKDSKTEEFPEFELSFDPFSDQSSK